MAQPTNTTPQTTVHPQLHNQAVDVAMFLPGGVPTGSDDTTYFAAALAASPTGKIKAGPGTFILNNWAPPTVGGGGGSGWSLEGAGFSTILKAKTAAAAAMSLTGLLHVKVSDVAFDGNAKAAHGVIVKGATAASSQGHTFEHVQFNNCDKGVFVDQGTISQADKNIYIGCQWANNNTGLHVNSVNAQEQLLIGGSFDTHTTAIRLTHGSLTWISGQVQGYTTGILIDGGSVPWLNMRDVILEGGTTDIDGSAAWPTNGVVLEHCFLQGTGSMVKMTGHLHARFCTFSGTGKIDCTGNDLLFIDEMNQFAGGSSFNPTGVNDRRWQVNLNGLQLNQPAANVNQIAFGDSGAAAADVNLYRVAANQLKSDDTIIGADGVATKTKAGTPVDGDFATTPPSGTIVVDTTASKIWVRVGATWKGVVVA